MTEAERPIPSAIALEARPIRSSPGSYTVAVECPYCSSVHIHGWGGPGDSGGHRRPHCINATARKINSAGYDITIPENLKVRNPQ